MITDVNVLLKSLLELDPPPMVVALGEFGEFRPLPAILRGHMPEVTDWVWLDLVEPTDQTEVLAAWERMRAEGSATTVVHVVDSDEDVLLEYLDAYEEHDVYLVIAHGVPSNLTYERLARLPPLKPRRSVAHKDETGAFSAVDDDFTKIFGWAADDIVGRRHIDYIHPDDRERWIRAWVQMQASPERAERVRVRHSRSDGSWLWVDVTNRILADGGPRPIVAELVDVSEEMDALEAVRESERLFYGLAESLPIGLIHASIDGTIIYTNDRLPDIVGAAAAATIHEQFQHVVDEDRPTLDAALEAVSSGSPDGDIEVRIRMPDDGSLRWGRLTIRRLEDADGQYSGAIVCVADVTDNARVRVDLERQATFDPLTGCHNRTSVMVSLGAALDGHDEATTALFVDLDRFKRVNDLLGHAAGDELLQITADRLRRLVRAQDTLGRIGGDEFLIVCPGLASPTDALALAERIASGLAEPVTLSGALIEVQASVGVARSRRGDATPAALVADADAAMYESKRKGVGEAVLHRASVGGLRPLRGTNAPALRRALAGGELAVHFQSVVDLTSGVTVGFEALLRWRQAGRWAPAQEFIELAEVTGLIVEIGAWVTEEVCRQVAPARRLLDDHLLWFVNVSSLELAVPRMAVSVIEVLERHGLPPEAFVYEVTEHAGLTDGAIAHRNLLELDEAGVGVALDDFGTGWSSLSLLRRLPVSWLKVDRSFIDDLTTGNDRHLVCTVLDLARRIDASVVIEGVEREDQRCQLLALGAKLAQGYLFSRPQPLENFVPGLRG